MGLKEVQPEVVQATLHALGDLVPLVGPEAVIGTTRRPIFADTKPRVSSLSLKPYNQIAGAMKFDRSFLFSKFPTPFRPTFSSDTTLV